MNKLKELLRQHNLSTIGELSRNSYNYGYGAGNAPDPVWVPKRDLLRQTYGDKVQCEEKYAHATIRCKATPENPNNYECSHYIYVHEDSFAYSWPGQHYLISKTPIPIDVFHELIVIKSAELEAARKKRFETIKSPRDAMRILFRDLGTKVSMVAGNPRFDCGPFDIEFQASKDDSDPKVQVSIIYRSHYVNEIKLVMLSIADPNFNQKVEAIIFNGANLNKLLLGELQPQPLVNNVQKLQK